MAHISVSDVLSMPSMRGADLLAGRKGLNRAVRSVNIMEVPDVEAFVRSGDLLLTTAYPIHHNPEILVDLVKVFHRQALGALAIKCGRYLDEFPPGLLEICDELSFPLLKLPADQSFDEILGEVMSITLAEYGPEPGRADAIRDRLTAIALNGGSFQEIAGTLSESINATVKIVASDGVLIAGSTVSTLSAGAEAPARPVEIFPIKMAGRKFGTIRIQSATSITLAERRLIQQVCFAVGLHVAQLKAAAEVNRCQRMLALEDLVSGNDPQLSAFSVASGWQVDRLQQLCVAGPVTCECTLETSELWGCSSLVWQRGELLLTLFDPEQVTDLPRVAQAWHAYLSDGSCGCTVAVGERVPGPARLQQAHDSALDAWRLARHTQKPVALYGDLHMHLLLESVDKNAASRFVRCQLQSLIDYDSRHDGQLLNTLHEVLIAANRADAARRLFVHYNTLKYRLEQIRLLLGEDWDSPHHKSALLLALELYRLQGASH